jgi:glycosyl transferase, family 25
MTNQFPIYVINMAQDVGRMESMATQLSAQGLQFQRVEAVVGRELSAEQRNRSYSPFWFGLLQGRRITDGEIGCALSHRKVYQMMLDRGQGCAVIMEDDVQLLPQFAKDLSEMEQETREFDMVHLFAFRAPDKVHHEASSFRVMTFSGTSSSAAAYLLRDSGARKLLSLTTIRVAADKWVWLAALTGLKRCGVEPYPVELYEKYSSVSTIDEEKDSVRHNNQIWKVGVLPWLRIVRSLTTWLKKI